MAAISAKIHKWLALLMALQILFWFVSGLFFAVFPIERVRSEHVIAEPAAAPVPFDVAADGLLRLGSAGISGERVEIRTLLGRPVALIAQGEQRPRLYDLASARPDRTSWAATRTSSREPASAVRLSRPKVDAAAAPSAVAAERLRA